MAAVDELRSGTFGPKPAVVPDNEVGGRDPIVASESIRPKDDISGRSCVRPAPAAAMICGLSGLEVALARLPFLECCMPCTIDVCRWWPYVAALESGVRSLRPDRDVEVCTLARAEEPD